VSLDVARQPSAAVILTALVIFLIALAFPGAETGAADGTGGGTVAGGAAQGLPLAQLVAATLPRWAQTVAAAALSFVNAVILTRIAVRNMLYGARSYLPATIYAVAVCAFVRWDAALCLASTLIVAGLDTLIAGMGRAEGFDRCFRGSLAVGLAVTLYAPAALMIAALPVVLSALSRSGREVVVSLVGALLPLAALSYIYMWAGFDFLYYPRALADALLAPSATTTAIATIALAGLLSLLSLLSLATLFFTGRTMRRRAWRITLLFGLTLPILWAGALLPCRGTDMAALTAIPTALIAPIFFARNPGWLSTVIYIMVLVAALAAITVR
jgi:hypothetical protein